MIGRKAVLVSVGNDYTRFDVHMPIAPPLGILALGSYLERHGVPVELIDVQVDFGFSTATAAEPVLCERVADYLAGQAESIAWIGISMLSNNGAGLVLGEAIRRALPDTPIIYGGYFPIRVYGLLLESYPFITAIVRGDGEAATLHISRLVAQGQPFPSKRVPNLAWREHGKIRTTPRKPMSPRALPNLNYRLLHNRRCYPAVFTMLSRGCPFRCTYCSESTMRPYAACSIDWIARQLDHLQKELVRADWHPRSDLLREAGVDLIFWGLESGSARTLRRMNKISKELPVKYPRVKLQREPFVGESSVLSPGAGLRLTDSKRYASAVSIFGSLTPNTLEQLDRFSTFVPKKFASAHPELTDRQGVTVVSPDLLRLG